MVIVYTSEIDTALPWEMVYVSVMSVSVSFSVSVAGVDEIYITCIINKGVWGFFKMMINFINVWNHQIVYCQGRWFTIFAWLSIVRGHYSLLLYDCLLSGGDYSLLLHDSLLSGEIIHYCYMTVYCQGEIIHYCYVTVYCQGRLYTIVTSLSIVRGDYSLLLHDCLMSGEIIHYCCVTVLSLNLL
jgi:hypothetical protein